MLRFANNQIKDTNARNVMIFITMMKIGSSVFTEIANILLISTEDNTLDIIKDFVALFVIAEIDSIYAKTMKNNSMREGIEGRILTYQESLGEKARVGLCYHMWRPVYAMFKHTYVCIYFYFMPFLVPVISSMFYLASIFRDLNSTLSKSFWLQLLFN